jgi:hypothetical protein
MSKVDDTKVRVELAELRAALATIGVPTVGDEWLRARFRAARRSLEEAVSVPPRLARGATRRYLAAACGALALITGVIFGLLSGEQSAPNVASVSASPRTTLEPPAFQPLPNSPGFSPTASYSVVRVRIPLASLAVVPGSEQGGTIDADLLVGEDGLAHGIRFTGGGAALGAAAVQ